MSASILATFSLERISKIFLWGGGARASREVKQVPGQRNRELGVLDKKIGSLLWSRSPKCVGVSIANIDLGVAGTMNSHNCHFLTYNQRSPPKGDENLTHDDVANSLVGLTEMNHEAHAENFETQHRQREPLEPPHCPDYHRNNDAPET